MAGRILDRLVRMSENFDKKKNGLNRILGLYLNPGVEKTETERNLIVPFRVLA